MSESPDSPLRFPTDYPVKIVGRPDGDFRERVRAIIERHSPQIPAERLSERPSANGNFVSISVNLHAHSRAQIEALVAELKSCPGVMMLL